MSSRPNTIDELAKSIVKFQKSEKIIPKFFNNDRKSQQIVEATIVYLLHQDPTAIRRLSNIRPSQNRTLENLCIKGPEDLRKWKEKYSDPESVKSIGSLCFHYVWSSTEEDLEWIRSLENLEQLAVSIEGQPEATSLASFEAISQGIKSLKLNGNALPLGEIFGLISRCPVLEDLHVSNIGSGEPPAKYADSGSELTGTLVIGPGTKADFVRRLSGRVSTPRFEKFVWKGEGCGNDEIRAVAKFLKKCSSCLEHLEIDIPFGEQCPFGTLDRFGI